MAILFSIAFRWSILAFLYYSTKPQVTAPTNSSVPTDQSYTSSTETNPSDETPSDWSDSSTPDQRLEYFCSIAGNCTCVEENDSNLTVTCTSVGNKLEGVLEGIPSETTHLILRNNGITRLSADGLMNLPNLEVLDIRDNNLTTPGNPEVQAILAGLSKVLLDDNPLECDCRIMRSLWSAEVTGTCVKPPHLRGVEIGSLFPQDLTCARSCAVLFARGQRSDGLYSIIPPPLPGGARFKPFKVWCDMSGGWVLLQQRINGTVDFFNDWLSYKYGFGVAGFEFWLGNQPVYAITATGRHVLRLEMYYSNGSFVFAEYDNFRVASRRTNYTLHVGQYRGNLSNILSPANNSAFSSWDRDVDMVDGACARVKKGAWWYNSSCDIEDLNSNLLNLTERGLLKVVMKSKPFKYAKGSCNAIRAKGRTECGWTGITKEECLTRDCCYDKIHNESIVCFIRPQFVYFERDGCFEIQQGHIQSLEEQDPLLMDSYRSRRRPTHACSLVARSRGFKGFAIRDRGECLGDVRFPTIFPNLKPSGGCVSGRGGRNVADVYHFTVFVTTVSKLKTSLITANSVRVEWNRVPELFILGYRVIVGNNLIDRMVDWKLNQADIYGLESGTTYVIRVFPVHGLTNERVSLAQSANVVVTTKPAHGPKGPDGPTAPDGPQTSGKVPSRAPASVSAWSSSSRSLRVNWTGVPKEFLHGHLIGYQLSYSPANQLKSSLTLMVPPRTTHKLQHLSVFTLYVIHVSAVNMKGAGPKSAPVMARTGESAPSAPPNHFCVEYLGPSSIIVVWEPVPKGSRNGRVQGYRVVYQAHNKTFVGNVSYLDVGPEVFRAILDDLSHDTQYRTKVAAFTRAGQGPFSESIITRTKKYNPCDENQCLNGGTCLSDRRHDKHKQFYCACSRNFTGFLCERFTGGKNQETLCLSPNVSLSNLSPAVSSAVSTLRSLSFVIRSEVRLNCNMSYETIFNWEVYHLNSSTGDRELRISRNGSSELRIRRRLLSVGNHLVQLTVGMLGTPVFGVGRGFIRVASSPLLALITGGTKVERGFNTTFVLNASLSRDPDDHNELSGLSFTWLCRRANEEYSDDLLDLSPVLPSSRNPVIDRGGCFGTGPGKVGSNTPVIRINSGLMVENSSYFITVVVEKGRRRVNYTQEVVVVPGEPPEVEISCVDNCDKKINPSRRIALLSTCSGSPCGGLLSYDWSLFQLIGKDQSNNTHWIRVPKLQGLLRTRMTSPRLVTKRQILSPGAVYKFSLRAKRHGAHPGLSEYEVIINTPPVGGICNVSPRSGTSLKTEFRIICSGWVDAEVPLQYEFIYFATEEFPSVVYVGQRGRLVTHLPAGEAIKNFTVDFRVRVHDVMGAFTEIKTPTQVFEPEEETTNLVEFASMLTIGKESQLALLIQSGDLSRASQLASATIIAIDQRTGRYPRAREKFKKKLIEIKSSIVERLSAVRVETVERIQQTSMVIAQATAVINEVSEDAQKAAGEALVTMTTVLKAASEEGENYEALLDGAGSLVSGLGNMLRVTSYRAKVYDSDIGEKLQNQGNTDAENAQSSRNERMKRRTGKWTPWSPEFPSKRQKKSMGYRLAAKTNNNNLQLKSKEDSLKILRSLHGVGSTILSRTLVGEAPRKLSAISVVLQVSREEPHFLAGAVLSHERSSFALPSALDVLGNHTQFVDSQMMITDFIPFTWDPSGARLTSGIASLQIKNSSGSLLKMDKLKIPISVTLPQMSNTGTTNTSFSYHAKSNRTVFHKINVTQPDMALLLKVRPLSNTTKLLVSLRYKERPSPRNGDFNATVPDYSSCIQVSDAYVNCSKDPYMVLVSNTHVKQTGYYFIGIKVDEKTSADTIHCLCDHLTAFGGQLFVAPNPIDFDKVFTELANLPETGNVAVIIAVGCAFALYLLLLLWARRADKRDAMKVGNKPFLGVMSASAHRYEVQVSTGIWYNAGTTANVHVVLIGEQGRRSRPFHLTNASCILFARGSVTTFSLSLPESIGAVERVQVWHDNSGFSPSWFLNSIKVLDTFSSQQWVFPCYKWLSARKGDSSIVCQTELFSSAEHDENKVRASFQESVAEEFGNGHLWFSVVTRPPCNRFTRTQRLSCCLLLLLTTMLASAMFYELGSVARKGGGSLRLGRLVLNVRELVIALQSLLVVVPINLLVVQFFSRARPANIKKSSRLRYTIKKSQSVPSSAPKDKCRFVLPYWFTYIAWIVCLLASVVSAVFVVFYSLQWGKQTSEEWLVSTAMAVFIDIFMFEPLKIFFFVLMLSLFCAKTTDDEQEPSYAGSIYSFNDVQFNEPRQTESEQDIVVPNMLKSETDGDRGADLIKERLLYKMLRKIIIFVLYLWILMVICYGAHSRDGFLMTSSVRSTIGELSKISSQRKMLDWAREVLVPALYEDGKDVGGTGSSPYTGDGDAVLVGMPRLRQFRVRQDSCEVVDEVRRLFNSCVASYSPSNEDRTRSHGPNWLPLPASKNTSFIDIFNTCPRPWLYSLPEQTSSIPFWGGLHSLSIYGPGGYQADLGYDKNTALRVISELSLLNWTDRYTSAVLVEFTVFNTRVNLFSSVVIPIEFSPSGHVVSNHVVRTMYVYDLGGGYSSLLLTCQVLLPLFVVYFVVKEAKEMIADGREYFLRFLNWVELFQIVTAILFIIMHVIKEVQLFANTAKLHENIFQFISFDEQVLFDDMETVFLALLMFFNTLKMLYLIKFNSHVTRLFNVMKESSLDLINCFLVFTVFMFAFSHYGYLQFGRELYEYSSPLNSVQSLILQGVVSGKVEHLQACHEILGPLFFVLFNLGLHVIWINIFIAILIYSYHTVEYAPTLGSLVVKKLVKMLVCLGNDNEIMRKQSPLSSRRVNSRTDDPKKSVLESAPGDPMNKVTRIKTQLNECYVDEFGSDLDLLYLIVTAREQAKDTAEQRNDGCLQRDPLGRNEGLSSSSLFCQMKPETFHSCNKQNDMHLLSLKKDCRHA